MSEEWTEWKLHDGKGCPTSLLGMFVEVEYISEDGETVTGYRTAVITPLLASCASWYAAKYLGSGNNGHWEGRSFRMEYARRYRIRKPRGLTMLEDIAKGVREPQEVGV